MSTLSTVTRGRAIKPPRTVIYGTDKIGKTSFAAGAPSPIFIQAEEGDGVLDIAAFPVPQSLDDVREYLRALRDDPHDYRTLVVDSLDWMEALVWRDVCGQQGKAHIEDFGYGKGYTYARDTWRDLLHAFDELRNERRMSIIAICHAEIRRFDSPISEPYDRFQIKLHKAASALVSEWADVIGFAHFNVAIEKTDVGFKKEIHRAESLGRVLFLEEQPAFDAGNRYNLPPFVPLEYSSYKAALQAALTRPTPTTPEEAAS